MMAEEILVSNGVYKESPLSTYLKMLSLPQALTPLRDSQSAAASITCPATESEDPDDAAPRLDHAFAREAVKLEMALEEGEATFEEAPTPEFLYEDTEESPEIDRGRAGKAQAQTLSRT